MEQDLNAYLHNLVQLATYVCQTPTALINISDKKLAQYSVKFGWNVSDWHDNLPFCAYTRLNSSQFVVEDAQTDPRFATHPLVQEVPHVRFYAGTPLITSQGIVIGTLSVIDYVPRTLNSQQQQVLTLLAYQTIIQLETHSSLWQTTSTLEMIKEQARTLQHKYHQLQAHIRELEQQNLTTQLLNQLGTSLQTCITFDEAYQAITPLLSQIFPSHAGRVFVVTESQQNMAQLVLEWRSQTLPALYEIPLDSCQALRSEGQQYASNHVNTDACCLCCHKVLASEEQQLLCFLLTDEDNILGMLHLYSTPQETFSPIQYQFVWKVINQLRLAFKNLQLLNTLKLQSIRDPLTGLFNRRYFKEILERLLSQGIKRNYNISLIMIDIDHFKRLNDTFGHPAGDTVLRDFSIFLKGYVRPTDIACRYGGEEFALVLPECSLRIALQRAEKLRRGIHYMVMQHNGQRLGKVTISLGVATFPYHASTLEKLVEVADKALYRAKSGGRDRACTPESKIN